MNILILGAAGFLGRNLYYHYAQEHKVTAVDSLDSRLKSEPPDFRIIQADIRDKAAMFELVQSQEIIFNCAAQTSHPLSMQDPFFDAEINVLGNLVLLEQVKETNPEATIFYPSSSTVLGPYRGEAQGYEQEQPLDIYNAHKLTAEKHYHLYKEVYGLNTRIVRLPNLFGPYGKPHPEFGFVNYFIHLAKTGKDITVYGSGTQRRNVLYIKDALRLIDLALESTMMNGRAMFGVHDDHLSVMQIAQTICSVYKTGSKVRKVVWPPNRYNIEIGNVKISSRIIRDFTGWRPHYSFRAGLEDML